MIGDGPSSAPMERATAVAPDYTTRRAASARHGSRMEMVILLVVLGAIAIAAVGAEVRAVSAARRRRKATVDRVTEPR